MREGREDGIGIHYEDTKGLEQSTRGTTAGISKYRKPSKGHTLEIPAPLTG